MSRFIHIEEKVSPWRAGLALLCVAALLIGIAAIELGGDDDDSEPAGALARLAIPASPARVPIATASMQADAPKPTDDGPDEPAARQTATAPTIVEPDPATIEEFATRNSHIDVRLLTVSRPGAARTFLTEVLLAPGSGGAYVVAEVLPESRYERLGLRPGDVVYTLDTPKMAAFDETSMVSLIQQSEIELDVYRNGTLVHLQDSLATPDDDAHARAQR